MTLLGDAAHLDVPPAGDGVNSAMLDGAGSARPSLRAPTTSKRRLRFHEGAMFSRSGLAAVGAHGILELCFGERAPFSLVEFFTGMREPVRGDL